MRLIKVSKDMNLTAEIERDWIMNETLRETNDPGRMRDFSIKSE